MSSIPTPILKRLNTTIPSDNNPPSPSPLTPSSPLSIKISKNDLTLLILLPLKWRLGRKLKEPPPESSPTRLSLNRLTSPQQLVSHRKSRAVLGGPTASPLSLYEALRLYFKQGTRSVSVPGPSSPLLTPSRSTLNTPEDYKPIPSPFEQTKSPVQAKVKSPNQIRKAPSFAGFRRHAQTPPLDSPTLKPKTLISNFLHYSLPTTSHSQLYLGLHRPQQPRLNLKDKTCMICDIRLDNVLQTLPTQLEKIIELRCHCFCHEDCFRLLIKLEKERAIADAGSSQGSNSRLPLIEKVFPTCYHCGVSTRAIPKHRDLVDEFMTEYITYEPQPELIKQMKSPRAKLLLNTAITTSTSPGIINPYHNVNSPSGASKMSSPFQGLPSLPQPISPAIIANNPYIQNTLKLERGASPIRPLTKVEANVRSPAKTESTPKSQIKIEQTSKPFMKSEPSLRPITKAEPLARSSTNLESSIKPIPKTEPTLRPQSSRSTLKLTASSERLVPRIESKPLPPKLPNNLTVSRRQEFPPIPVSKQNQFQVQRQAPLPPVNAQERIQISQMKLNKASQKSSSYTKQLPQKDSANLHQLKIPSALSNRLVPANTINASKSNNLILLEQSLEALQIGLSSIAVLRLNSVSLTYLSALNTRSATSGSEDENGRLNQMRLRFVSFLKTKLMNKNGDLILDNGILSAFGQVRLVDRILVLLNGMKRFSEKVVVLFEQRLLVIDPSYKLFVLLKIGLQQKIPRVEICSTNIVKLDFSNLALARNRSRTITLVYILVQEALGNVIQKWAAALYDYDCTFPAHLFTDTMHTIVGADDVFLPTGADFKAIPSTSSSMFSHNLGLQSTLGDRDLNISATSPSHRLTFRGSSIYLLPKVLVIIMSSSSQIGSGQMQILTSIFRALLFKVPKVKLVVTTSGFASCLGKSSLSDDNLLFKVLDKTGAAGGTSFDVLQYLRTEVLQEESPREVGVLFLSLNHELQAPISQALLCKKVMIQVGTAPEDGKSISNKTLQNGVISVPIWDNLMEAICTAFHISFDDGSDADSMSDDLENESEPELDYESERNAELLSRHMEDLGLIEHNAKNAVIDKTRSKLLGAIDESDDSDGQYDSDDSTKEQLMKLKNDGVSIDDTLIEKFTKNQMEDSDGYCESAASESDSGSDLDDSTREQLLKINRANFYGHLMGPDEKASPIAAASNHSQIQLLEAIDLDSNEESDIEQEFSSPSRDRQKRDEATVQMSVPKLRYPDGGPSSDLKTPAAHREDSRSPTPRWSALFLGIDREWESLNDDDGDFMKFSRWKSLSLSGKNHANDE